MNDWAVLFLGLIALATLTTAIIQIAVVIVAGRLARRMERLADRVEREMKPMLGQLHAVSRDASRVSSLATAQAERLDRALGDLGGRLDETLAALQASAASTAREGAAVLSGIRAALTALKNRRAERSSSRAEEEDALFI